MIVEAALALAFAQALPERFAAIRVRSTPDDPHVAIRVTGRTKTLRGDRTVLYMARRCEPTLREAREHFVIAYNARTRRGLDRFRADVGPELVGEPRRGRVCLMLTGRDRQVRVQVSARYRLPPLPS